MPDQGLVKVIVTVGDRRAWWFAALGVLVRGVRPGQLIERGFGGGLACDTGFC
jgi:hypothetical protein